MWLSWVDDLAGFGEKCAVLDEVKKMSEKFAIDDVGEMTEYLGCVLKFNREPLTEEMPSELKSFFNCNFLSFLVPIILSSRVIEYVVKRIDVKIVC